MAESYGRLDIPMINRAIKDRFVIPDVTRIAVVKGMHNILVDQDSSDTGKAAAASVIARLDGLNLKHQDMMMSTLTVEGDANLLTDAELIKRIDLLEEQTTVKQLPEFWMPTEEDPAGQPCDARVISGPEDRYRGINSTRAPRS